MLKASRSQGKRVFEVDLALGVAELVSPVTLRNLAIKEQLTPLPRGVCQCHVDSPTALGRITILIIKIVDKLSNSIRSLLVMLAVIGELVTASDAGSNGV